MSDRTCSVPSCERPSVCRGWCHMHYMRWRTTGDPEKVKRIHRAPRGCTVEGCTYTTVKTRQGMCTMHYKRFRKSGDPTTTRVNRQHDGRCSVEGCPRPYTAKGYCSMHFQRFNTFGDPGGLEPGWQLGPETCSVPGCDRPHRSRGYCSSHSQTLVRKRRVRAVFDEQVHMTTVIERDGWTCGLCGDPVDPAIDWPDSMSASIDHIIPIARGGRHNYENVQLAHLLCNLRKKDRIPT